MANPKEELHRKLQEARAALLSRRSYLAQIQAAADFFAPAAD
jgi:hypothetical protein